MATMVLELKKKKPVAGKAAKKADNNFYTYTQMVEKKAYELFERRGCIHGRDRDDWYEAQRLIEDELHR